MLADMVKIYRIYIWEKYTEGDITLVLYILDDWTRKLEIGEGIIEDVQ